MAGEQVRRRSARYQATVGLVQALGGGWDATTKPASAQAPPARQLAAR
jgi:outer membrane protein TolC